MQYFSKASRLIDQTKDDSIGAYWRHKKERREGSPDSVLSRGSPRLSDYILHQSPYPVSNPDIYSVYLLNTNSLNPKHLRQTNDRSELHLNPAIESLNRLTNKSFFASLR
jgi:hypothetical protein